MKKKYWRDIECYKCGERVNPASHYKNKKEEPNNDSDKASSSSKKDIDDTSRPSKSRKQIIVKKMKKYLKRTKNTFATMKTKIQEMEE